MALKSTKKLDTVDPSVEVLPLAIQQAIRQRQDIADWDKDGEYVVAARRMRAEQRTLALAIAEGPHRSARRLPLLPSQRAEMNKKIVEERSLLRHPLR